MIISKRRAAGLVLAAATALPLMVASPASAEAANCLVLLQGPTPSAEVDLENDGNPEVRVPSVTDVTLCVGADVVLTDAPNVWTEPCGELGSCMRFLVHYGLSGYAETGASFCYTADGSTICGETRDIRVPLDFLAGGTICVGYDLFGGHPCSGGQPIAFE